MKQFDKAKLEEAAGLISMVSAIATAGYSTAFSGINAVAGRRLKEINVEAAEYEKAAVEEEQKAANEARSKEIEEERKDGGRALDEATLNTLKNSGDLGANPRRSAPNASEAEQHEASIDAVKSRTRTSIDGVQGSPTSTPNRGSQDERSRAAEAAEAERRRDRTPGQPDPDVPEDAGLGRRA